MEFENVKEVSIIKQGQSVILTPVKPDWLSLADEPEVDKDFMKERPAVFDEERMQF
jgi:antitoxin VapB